MLKFELLVDEHFNIFVMQIGPYGGHFDLQHESGNTFRIVSKKFPNNLDFKKVEIVIACTGDHIKSQGKIQVQVLVAQVLVTYTLKMDKIQPIAFEPCIHFIIIGANYR